MSLDQDTLSILAVAAAAAAGISLLLNIRLARAVRRLRTGRRGRGGEGSLGRGPDTVVADLEDLSKAVSAVREDLSYAIQRVGLVRFDAFDDLGGKLSFAAALLDAEGSGIVLSSINGRADTRIYAKPIERGQSRHNLSEEEVEAIRRALSGAAG